MNGALLLGSAVVIFVLAYFLYGGFLSRLFGISPDRPTPSTTMRDGVDYVPAHPAVLFGHHFASIAGAGPIVGPILAGYFGWASVALWVILGCIFIGAVHDMSALFLSVRHKGKSIGSVIETVLGKPGRFLFLIFCWSTLVLVCAEFTRQVAATFVPHPEVATASLLFIALAVVFGLVVYRLHMKVLWATLIFVPIMFSCIWIGQAFPLDFVKSFGMTKEGAQSVWTIILLVYCFLASTLPVWILLQPRDYLNSYLLYAMMILGFLGVFIAAPAMKMEAFAGFTVQNAQGHDMTLFPILFVTVACGACSGFHALVASGTTSKQIRTEKDIRPISYGGMLLEGVLAILALIAISQFSCTGLKGALADQTPVALFSKGLAGFCAKLGIPENTAFTFMCLAVAAFLMTSVDTATRLCRFTWQELFTMFVPTDDKGVPLQKPSLAVRSVSNMYVATGLVVGCIAFLLLGNPKAARNLWAVFASANQLMAALTLLTASLWLLKNHMAYWVTFFPMLFMLAVSSCGLYLLCTGSWQHHNATLGIVTAVLLALAIVLVLFAIIRFIRVRMAHNQAS